MLMTEEKRKGLPAIAQRLRNLREAAGWTQQQLADRAGRKVAIIHNIEQGITADPRLETLRALAKALGVSLDQLAGEE